jgi:hypothetical protein
LPMKLRWMTSKDWMNAVYGSDEEIEVAIKKAWKDVVGPKFIEVRPGVFAKRPADGWPR